MIIQGEQKINLPNQSLQASNINQQFRKTNFRFRDIKLNRHKSPIELSPKKQQGIKLYSNVKSDFKTTYYQIQDNKKKFINTTTDFYSSRKTQIRRLDSLSPQKPLNSMRKSFFMQKSTDASTQRPPSNSNNAFRTTTLGFHRQNIFQDQSTKNYLNKYEFIKQLGKGSFSTVYLAKKITNKSLIETINKSQNIEEKVVQKIPQMQNINLEELVAIKVYQKFKVNKDPHKFKNIRKQISIMQNLSNDNILRIYESVQTLTKISLVVEYGGDQSLLEYLKDNYPLSEETIKQISKQLIEALIYLHDRNIAHRDVKLQNVLIRNNKVKLIDFGFSCLTHKNQKLSSICGTPNYMAPQVISRKEYIGEEADIWSYGVVVFALSEGRHPFKAETYNQLQRLVNRGKYEIRKAKNPAFIDFLKRILKVKGSQRPRAKQIVQLRWLRDYSIA